MGTNFHLASVREGTILNVAQFLSFEKVSGILSISFGHTIPEITIYFVSGKAITSEFGSMVGDDVLDIVLCQEYAIKEVDFATARVSQVNDKALIVRAPSLYEALSEASQDVVQCQARPFIFGSLPIHFPESGRVEALLQTLYDFPKSKDFLASVPVSEDDKQAPLPNCVLLHRALARNVINYKTPLVSLESLLQLIEMMQPLTDKEMENLNRYMSSLLPHPKATHMPIDRFYAFASAIESVANRHGPEIGEKTHRAINQLIQGS